MIKKLFVGFWVFLWNSLNFIRRLFLNLIVLFVLIAIGAGMWQGFQPQLSANTVLSLAPYGVLVEQWDGDPVEVALAEAFGESNPQTRLFDVLRAINAAATDEKISGIVISTNDFYGAGPAQLQDLATALRKFRDSGKPVYAYGNRFSQSQYFLAAQAEQIYMDPMGEVLLEGFASYRNYYADATEKLKANVNVFRVGEYKSAVEPWIRNSMSPAAREANRAWLDGLWSSWREHLAERRQIKPARLESYAQDFNQLLAASQGDAALAAQAVGLIDQLATPKDFAKSMSEIFGQAKGVDWPDYKKVDMYSYLAELDLADFQQEAIEPAPSIAVIVVQGALMEGAIGSGYADIAAIRDQLWQAAHDDNVAGVVVRVDSPGGTITAAESLRRAIALVRANGKPVYLSMGTLAASGGYWLATAAEQIWAQSDTLTGSIGIYGIVPTFERSLAELGVYTDGLGTSAFAGGFRVDRPLSPAVKESIQLYINKGYQRFITTVAEARNMEIAAVEKAASGRVWIGSTAQTLGLVDQLGGLDETLAALAEQLQLERYDVELYESEMDLFDELLVGIGHSVSLPASWAKSARLQNWLAVLEQEPVLAQVLTRANDQGYQLTFADVGFAWSPLTLQ